MTKNLVLYFSVYGTTKAVANKIANQISSDIIEIEPEISYDSNRDHYNTLAAYAKKEHDENMRPVIKNKFDITPYNNIFIGYPMWWYTFPMIIYTLFGKYDFSGKTIIPFNTHLGSNDGGTYNTIRELEPNANVLEGLPIGMKTVEKGCKEAVSRWLSNIGLNTN